LLGLDFEGPVWKIISFVSHVLTEMCSINQYEFYAGPTWFVLVGADIVRVSLETRESHDVLKKTRAGEAGLAVL